MRIRFVGTADHSVIEQAFPGLLTFRGNLPGMEGLTEVEGDVDEAELRAVIEGCGAIVDWQTADEVLGTKKRQPVLVKRVVWRDVLLAATGLIALADLVARILH